MVKAGGRLVETSTAAACAEGWFPTLLPAGRGALKPAPLSRMASLPVGIAIVIIVVPLQMKKYGNTRRLQHATHALSDRQGGNAPCGAVAPGPDPGLGGPDSTAQKYEKDC